MNGLKKILATEGLSKKAGRKLDVRDDSYDGGTGGRLKVIISQGRDEIIATMSEWEDALDEARREERDNEWER